MPFAAETAPPRPALRTGAPIVMDWSEAYASLALQFGFSGTRSILWHQLGFYVIITRDGMERIGQGMDNLGVDFVRRYALIIL